MDIQTAFKDQPKENGILTALQLVKDDSSVERLKLVDLKEENLNQFELAEFYKDPPGFIKFAIPVIKLKKE